MIEGNIYHRLTDWLWPGLGTEASTLFCINWILNAERFRDYHVEAPYEPLWCLFYFKTIGFNGSSILFNDCWPLVKRLNSNDPSLLSILDLGKVQCRKVSWLSCQSKPKKHHSSIISRFWILDSGSRQSPMQEGFVILMLEPHPSPVTVIVLFLDSRF